ncbi:hypothetical protein [Microcella sp.]|uniref:hypothetical protein n=1 Tax=Microcella sp. TaxID=1913979 RepID=UPI003918CD8E
MSLAAPTPSLKQAQTYLAMRHPDEVRTLARELKVANSLPQHMNEYFFHSFSEARKPNDYETALGSVNIWRYTARIAIRLHELLGMPEEAVLENGTLIYVSYVNNVPAETVSEQIIAVQMDMVC